MADLAQLLQDLDDDGQHELDVLLAEQGEQAHVLHQAAQVAADTLIREAVQATRGEAETEARQLNADAVAEARRTIDDAVEAEIADVAAQVQRALQALSTGPEAARVTLRLLAQAMSVLPMATHCRVESAHGSAVHDAAPGLTVDGGLDDIGVIVSDHSRAVDNTVRRRLIHAWPDLRVGMVAGWKPGGQQR